MNGEYSPGVMALDRLIEWKRKNGRPQKSLGKEPNMNSMRDLDREALKAMSEGIIFPEIEVQLTGEDGNAFAIIGAVQREMKRQGIEKEQRDQFMNEAMSGDYNHLLQTAMKWVTVL